MALSDVVAVVGFVTSLVGIGCALLITGLR
jgi:hypothetical protein